MVGNCYLHNFHRRTIKSEGMLKCEALFFRIGLLICWVSPEQRGAY